MTTSVSEPHPIHVLHTQSAHEKQAGIPALCTHFTRANRSFRFQLLLVEQDWAKPLENICQKRACNSFFSYGVFEMLRLITAFSDISERAQPDGAGQRKPFSWITGLLIVFFSILCLIIPSLSDQLDPDFCFVFLLNIGFSHIKHVYMNITLTELDLPEGRSGCDYLKKCRDDL